MSCSTQVRSLAPRRGRPKVLAVDRPQTDQPPPDDGREQGSLPDARVAVREKHALGWVTLLFCAGGAIALWPLALPLCLAIWLAHLARPLFLKLTLLLRGRSRSAALLAVGLLLVIVTPTTIVVAELAQSATELATVLAGARGSKARLRALVQEDDNTEKKPAGANAKELTKLAKEHGEEAKDIGKFAFLFTAGVLVFLFVLAFGFYAALAEGEKAWRWAQDHAPLRLDHLRRLAEAFLETGRGLLASVGITAAVQGVLCTTTYLLLGVPRAWVLGFISAIFSILPVVGTPLIWGPVAIGLQMSGETTKALILLAVGGGVIAIIENLVSPFFARVARFKLPTFLLVASVFGGVLALGPAGVLLGPLVLRMAQEALAIARDERLVGEGRGPLI